MLDELAEADARRFIDEWIAESLDTTPLTEDDRRRVVEGLTLLYRSQGIPWPDHVVWVRSPSELLAGARTSKSLIKKRLEPWADWTVYRTWPRRAFRYFLIALTGSALYVGIFAAMAFAHIWDWLGDDNLIVLPFVLWFTCGIFPSFFVANGIFRSLDDRHRIEFEHAFSWNDLSNNLIQNAGDRDDSGLQGHVDEIDGAVHRALREVWGRSGDFTRESVRPEVRGRGAGQIWRVGYEQVNLSDRAKDQVDGLVMVHRAVGVDAYRFLTLVCEPPLELHTEFVMDRYRLHNSAGPAVVWAGDPEIREYYLHGVRMPERLFMDDVSAHDLHAERDSKIRWLAIERMGWLRYVEEAGLRLVAGSVDPVDDLIELRLYDLPQRYYHPGRVLVTVSRAGNSGRMSASGAWVPREINDPVEAAAWLSERAGPAHHPPAIAKRPRGGWGRS